MVSTAPSWSPSWPGTGWAVQPLYIRFGLAWEAVEEAHLRRFLDALPADLRPQPLVAFDLPIADVYGAHWSVSGTGVPDETTPDNAVYLPGRNLLLLAKSSVWCALNGVEVIALGTLKGNPFADSGPDFMALLRVARAGSASSTRSRSATPFAGLTKAQVLELGRELAFEHTFSCIAPVSGHHCGRCNKCAERREGFAGAGNRGPHAVRGELTDGSGLRRADLLRDRRPRRVAAGDPGPDRGWESAARGDLAGGPCPRAAEAGAPNRRTGRLRRRGVAAARVTGDRLVDLRDHPLQRDFWWGSAAFEEAFGPLNINEILGRICADFGIDADLSGPIPLEAHPRPELGGSVLLVNETDGVDKAWPADRWAAVAAAARRRRPRRPPGQPRRPAPATGTGRESPSSPHRRWGRPSTR